MGKQKQTGLSVLLSLNTKKFTKGISMASKKLTRLGKDVSRLGSSISRSIGAPIAAAVGLASKSIVDFEFALAKVKAVSGFTSGEMGKLEAQAKQLGASTSKSASEVAGLQLELAKLGNSSGEIQNMTEAILSLSIAFDEDLGESARIVGATLNQFNLDSSEAGRVADVMAAAFGGSALDLGKFDAAMQKSGPTAKALGLSLEETTAALGVLTNNGIEASTAGTALTKAFTTLAKEGYTGAEALEALFDNNMSVARSFELFGDRAGKIIPVLQKSGTEFDNLNETLLNSEGRAAEARKELESTAKGGLDKMKSAVEALALSFSDLLLPKINQMSEFVAGLAGHLANLDDKMKAQIVRWAGIASAIGPTLFIGGKLITLFGTIGGILGGITAPILAAVAAIAGAAYLIYTEWDNIVLYFTEGAGAGMFDKVRDATMFALNAIIGFVVEFVNWGKRIWAEYGDDIIAVVVFMWEQVVSTFSNLFSAIGSLFNVFKNLFQGDWEGAWNAAKAFIARIAVVILETLQSLVYGALKLWDMLPWADGTAAEGFLEWSNGVIAGVEDAALALEKTEDQAYDTADALSYAAKAWEGFSSFAGGFSFSGGGGGGGGGEDPVEGEDGAVAVEPAVQEAQLSFWDKLKGKVKEFKDETLDLKSIMEGMMTNLQNAVTGILEGTMSAAEGIRQVVVGAIDALLAQAQAAMIAAAFKDAATAGVGGIALAPLLLAAGTGILRGAVGAIPAFAEGGAVLSPTLALVGEKAGSRGEAIIPFEKMTDFARKAIDQDALGGGNNVVVTGRISGSDIVISNTRGTRARSRF